MKARGAQGYLIFNSEVDKVNCCGQFGNGEPKRCVPFDQRNLSRIALDIPEKQVAGPVENLSFIPNDHEEE